MARDPGTGVRQPRKRKRPVAQSAPQPRNPDRDIGQARAATAPDPEVLRRQRALRAAGYGVAVDGIWGPQSQAAWRQYLSRPTSSSPSADIEAVRTRNALSNRQRLVREAARRAQAHARQAVELARIHAAEAKRDSVDLARDREIAKLRGGLRTGLAEGTTVEGPSLRRQTERMTRIAVREQRQDAIRFANKARRKAPEELTSRELLALTVNPITGSFPDRAPNREETILVQRWLKAHGHPELSVDGVFGRQTGEAFIAAYERMQREEAASQRRALVEAVYEPGIVKEGEEFPILGKAPKPGELLKILQRGGFTARLLARELIRRIETPEARWLFERRRMLADLERRTRGPLGQLPKFLAGDDQDRFLRLLFNATMAARDDRLRDEYISQVQALVTSTTAVEFERRIESINYADEKAYQEFHKRRAAQKPSAWGKTLDLLDRPAEWSQRKVTEGAIAVRDFAWELANDGDSGEASAMARALSRGYAAQVGVFDQRPIQTQAEVFLEMLEREHPYMNLAFKIAVDPLWLVPGSAVTAPFKVTARTVLAAERLGYRVAAAGHLAPFGSFQPLAVRFTETIGGALIVPADATRQLGHLAVAIKDTPAAQRVAVGVHKATRQIHESVGIARYHTAIQFRHRFGSFVSRSGFQVEAPKLGAAEREALLSGSNKLDAVVDKVLKPVIGDLHRGGQSLYADDAMRNTSWLGGATLARVIDGVRVNLVQDVAHSSAMSVFRAILREEGSAGLAAAKQAARVEYKRMIDASASYLVGNASPEITEIIGPRLHLALDQLNNAILPAIQRRLIALGEEAGVELFDDVGRYLNRADEASRLLRALAREAFTDGRSLRVRNPLHGRVVSFDEMRGFVQNETDVAVRRLHSYNARRRANGETPWSEEALARKANAERERIQGYWKQVPGGFTDTREFLEIPDIYARQYAELYRGAAEGTHPFLAAEDVPQDVREILQLAAPPADVAGQEFDGTIELLSWALSGRRPIHQSDLELSEAFRGLVKDSPNTKDVDDFREALDGYWQLAMDAYDVALPRNLVKEFALWRAMKEAQSRPLKYLYRGLQGWLTLWTTAVLPLRPGFLVRNVIDNAAKAIVSSHIDPRVLMFGGRQPGSIFDLDLRLMRHVLSIGGRFQGNPAVIYFEKIRASLWGHGTDRLKTIFESHGVPVPEEIIDSMKMSLLHQTPHIPKPIRSLDEAEEATRRNIFEFLHDKVWELMATRPEAYAKRALYRNTYHKAVSEGKDTWRAMDEAIKKVDEVLFDYSKYSTLEDNLRFVFPFIYFWRRTTQFWVTQSVKQPWLPIEFALFQERWREEVHGDWPEWMRRYLHANEVADLLGRVPGLGWLADSISSLDLMADPASYLSFNVLYRTFKGANEGLPPDKAGMRFIGDFIDAINDFGLSMNPFLRKPLELAGVANYRAWQSVFPQTSLAQAFTRKYFNDRFPDGINLEAWATDKLFELIGEGPVATERIAANFNFYVQVEMSAQAARGEQVSREKAEEKIRDYFLVQNLIGYFGGIYARRMDPTSFYLYRLSESVRKQELDYLGLSREDQRAYQLFRRKRLPEAEFDSYLEALPLIEAYYSAYDEGGYRAAERFKQEHPEILPHVDSVVRGLSPYTNNAVSNTSLMADTGAAMRMFELLDKLDVAEDVRRDAESLLVTPELREFWSRNDTPRQQRDRMLKGLFFAYIDGLNKTYHSLPETDHDAKQGFLKEHPTLVAWWQRNEDGSDDLKDVLNSVNAALREEYFNLVNTKGWDAAAAFLKQFPFMFEFTKAADRVSPSGEWEGRSTGTRSQKAADYLRAKPWLDYYYSLPQDARARWLQGGSQGAKVVQQFFDRYASKRGMTAHARDYLATKNWLDHYFSLEKVERRTWLDGGSRGAMAVKEYFKKYGTLNKYARMWGKLSGSADPEINTRLQFWKRFFQLTPDQRPDFVHRQAEKHGIFVYGVYGDDEREAKERRYLRQAIGRGLTEKAAMYLRVAPLLDLFFNIEDKAMKRLFLRANPEVQEYLDKYSQAKLSGDPKVDGLIEAYFQLPSGSDERSEFLKAHPEVQRYFNSKASKAERALYAVLDVYFALPYGPKRKEFVARHPEISEYFERRRRERENELMLAMSFDEADPRLAALREQAEREIAEAARHKRYELALSSLDTPETLEQRRERRPLYP